MSQKLFFYRGIETQKRFFFSVPPHKPDTNYYKINIRAIFAKYFFQNGFIFTREFAPHKEPVRIILEGAALPNREVYIYKMQIQILGSACVSV